MITSLKIMKFHMVMWRIFGLWPTKEKSYWYTAYTYITRIIFLYIFNFSTLLQLFFAKNVSEFMEGLTVPSTTYVVSVEALLMYGNRKKIQKLLDLMEQIELADGVNGISVPQIEKDILMKIEKECNLLNIFLLIIYFGGISLAFLGPYLSSNEILMWKAVVPFAWTGIPVRYHCLMWYQYCSTLFIGISASTLNLYGPVMYYILSGYLNILGNRLKNLGRNKQKHKSDSNDKTGINHKENALYWENELRNCSKYHELCLEFSETLDQTIGLHYSIQFIASGLVICSAAYELSTMQIFNNPSKFIFLCEYLFSMLVQMFLPCYYGSVLTQESKQLAIQAYNSNWTEQSVRFKSGLQIFIERVLRPIVPCTAEGVFIIGLPTFVTISRAAFSLLSCLKGSQGGAF